jgi:hypothetical protein
MWIIFGVLFSLSALALEPFETVRNAKIIKVLPQNIVLIDHGLEDGILKNDHAKFSNENGYASRAICIRAAGSTSYWKLYRIPYAEAISKDLSYSIIGMADKEIPSDLAILRESNQEIAEDAKKAPELSP